MKISQLSTSIVIIAGTFVGAASASENIGLNTRTALNSAASPKSFINQLQRRSPNPDIDVGEPDTDCEVDTGCDATKYVRACRGNTTKVPSGEEKEAYDKMIQTCLCKNDNATAMARKYVNIHPSLVIYIKLTHFCLLLQSQRCSICWPDSQVLQDGYAEQCANLGVIVDFSKFPAPANGGYANKTSDSATRAHGMVVNMHMWQGVFGVFVFGTAVASFAL